MLARFRVNRPNGESQVKSYSAIHFVLFAAVNRPYGVRVASAAVKMPVRPARNVEYTDNLKSVEEILSRNGHIFVELKDKVIVVFNIVNYVSYILQGNLSLSPL
jgi:hypothetical protein